MMDNPCVDWKGFERSAFRMTLGNRVYDGERKSVDVGQALKWHCWELTIHVH